MNATVYVESDRLKIFLEDERGTRVNANNTSVFN